MAQSSSVVKGQVIASRLWELDNLLVSRLATLCEAPSLVICLCPGFWCSGRVMVNTKAGLPSQWWVWGEGDSLLWCRILHLLLGEARECPKKMRLKLHFLDEHGCFRQEELFVKSQRKMKTACWSQGAVSRWWLKPSVLSLKAYVLAIGLCFSVKLPYSQPPNHSCQPRFYS